MATESSEATSSSEAISEFIHTPFYCEENIYFLCKKLCENGKANADGSDLFVVFISNEKKAVGFLSNVFTKFVLLIWDNGHLAASFKKCHSMYVQRKRDGDDDETSSTLVWDMDSSLPFPSPLDSYLSETTRPSFELFSDFQRFYRVVHAPVFLRGFASDRSHMKDSAGNWNAQPPAYEPVVAEDGTVNNLKEYMDIHAPTETVAIDELTKMVLRQDQKHGVVLKESQVKEFFSQLNVTNALSD
ncbi:unnamed protein product [Linum tenue]|uniref:Protein N-terminal glutamine amidohydrolase n=1 Tax=Linum tenue TaxID=586396 RepID=A0AAV0LUS0_9ROSI|nr:unnamed protein product [Linum tenue]